MGIFRWGCAEWFVFFVLIAAAFGIFTITTGIFHALLIALLGYEVSKAPDSLAVWGVVLTIAFWLGLFVVYGCVSVRKMNRAKATLLGSEPSTLSPADFERFVALWLEKNGYCKVEVVGKNGDYGADVIAKDRSGHMMAVQCKRYRGSTGIRSVQEVFSAKSYYGCGRSAVFTTGYFTRQARELAEKNGVELYCWNGRSFEREN